MTLNARKPLEEPRIKTLKDTKFYLAVIFLTVCMLASLFIINSFIPVRVSPTAIDEASKMCGGGLKELSANQDFVYAKCFNDQPITVQNYLLR